ncbi:hypothetical protein AMAG_20242 [Allomyces macrogynus ATCC 38327]|uniref:Potassium channel domain-containing protein n=1 Tax=Allomyces macrogynus (strain ATCC 38327) TaxID=578462 RepID=A0A0L0T600_ALLM3|nr:hypothetical protein AMAG_20242 [Allomyces macrogynus ATCC 38327]|eukprot:KNE70116.1 hypothetical protein AMAG_20242 [Allomyces macrogynus ATCC 38327]
MSSTSPSDRSASTSAHGPDIMAAPDITVDAGADEGSLPSPARRRFSADWWRTRFTTATSDDPLAAPPVTIDATADFPTPPPPDFPSIPLPPPPPPRSEPTIRRDGGSGGRTRPFSVPATAALLDPASPDFASPVSAPTARMNSRRLFRPHSVDELWGGTSHDALPTFQHRLRRHQSGRLRDRFMTNQAVGSAMSEGLGAGGSVSAFAPAIPLQRFHTHTQPIDLPFDRTETMDTNDFRSSWFFGSGGRRRRDDAGRENDDENEDDDEDDADEVGEDETDAHVGASTSDSEGAAPHRSRIPLAGNTNATPTRRPSLLRMRHEQRQMRREEHDRSTMSDLGLSADFQDHVTKYRRTWRANWPTRRTSAMNTASLQSINPARYVYERRHRKARQSPLEGFGGHLWSALTVGRHFDRVRESKPLRAFFILLHLVTDLALVVLYLVEMAAMFPTLDTQVPMPGFHPPWLWVPRPFPIYIVGLSLAMINLVAFVSRLAFSDDLLRTLVSWDTPVDLLTTVPFFVSIFLYNGRLLYIPYFLRSIPCISRLRRFLHIRLELSDTIEAVDALREKLTALVATIVGIIYVTMCAFQYAEVMFGNQSLTIIDSVYVTVVTLTTVGYGDMTPKSWQGKLVVVVGILVSFVFVPGLVSSAVETWKVRRDGGGTFSKRKRLQHVVLIGRFEDPRLVSSLLQALFHSETSKPLKVVFLSRRRPPTAVKALINAPLFRDRVFYIQGSALNDADLQRAQIASADAVFFISNNTTAEDERNVLRVWSVVRHAPLTHLYIYTHRPEFERYHTVHSTAVVCADEMKQSLLGSNCIHRGVATLIINLISTTTPEDHYEVPWMAQYGDGMGHEIYNLHVPELFRGCQFHHIAAYLLLEFQVVVIAVRIPVLHRTAEFETIDYHVILNPGAEYVLRGNEELVCIAQGLHEIHLIQAMSAEQFERSLHAHPPIFTTMPSSAPASRFTLGRRPTTTSIVPPEALLQSLPKLLGTPYLIDQPEAPFTDSRKVSLCHLLRTPPTRVTDVVLDDARDLSGHILVITPSWYLFRFLTTVRAAHIPAEDLRPILFMSPNLPTHDEFRVLAPFPLVHYLQGNPRRRKDLLRANVTAADRVVILSDLERSTAPSSPPGRGGKTDENGGGSDDFVDLAPILTRHLVAHVAARPPGPPATGAAPDSPSTLARRGNMYTMVELSDSKRDQVPRPVV